MNPDAGTEDFFWREMNEAEEEFARKLIQEQSEADRQAFLEKIREKDRKRQRR